MTQLFQKTTEIQNEANFARFYFNKKSCQVSKSPVLMGYAINKIAVKAFSRHYTVSLGKTLSGTFSAWSFQQAALNFSHISK